MWIARNENGRLYLFGDRPKRVKADYSFWITLCNPHYFGSPYSGRDDGGKIELADWLYPEVTFENSPKELVIK